MYIQLFTSIAFTGDEINTGRRGGGGVLGGKKGCWRKGSGQVGGGVGV